MKYYEDIRNHIPLETREEFIPVDIQGAELRDGRGILLAGISDLTPGYQMGRLSCPFTLLMCVLSGEGACYREGIEYSLKEGDILMIRSEQDHIYGTSVNWRILWFHLDPGFWRDGLPPFIIRSGSEMIHSLLRVTMTYLRESQEHRDLTILSDLSNVIGRLIRRILMCASSGDRTSRDVQIVDRLLREISRNLSRNWTVSELSELAGITSSYLFKITDRTLGQTPLGLVKKMQMELAVQLLKHSDYPLKYIAERLGYSTPYAFSKAFRKIYGISPGAYRSKV